MSATAAEPWVGRPLKRKEDPRLIMGRARYIDDINVTGQLWAAFVRSPEAHAKITSIDTSEAQAYPGVHAVFTGHDLDLEAPLPMAWVPPGVEVKNPPHWSLAKDEVHHVGDPVALVIGSDRYAVVDAAQLVSVEYEPLPVVVDLEKAYEGGDLVHADLGTNQCHEWSLGGGDLDAGFEAADVIVERRIVNHRTVGAAIEPRGVLADYRAGRLTLTELHPGPALPAALPGAAAGDQRGPRSGRSRPRSAAASAPSCRSTARRSRWRGPHASSSGRSSGSSRAPRACSPPITGATRSPTRRSGATRDGKITAYHTKILQDLGAYLMLLTPTIPSLGAFVMSGVYDIPAVHTDIVGVFTNKMPTDAIRGAGRPEATHQIEMMIDQLADELGMDRLELRRKNFMQPETFPHETAIGVVYDSGDYPKALDTLLALGDLEAIKAEAPPGKLRGIGYSTYTEICGLAPSRVTGPSGFGLQTGLWESAMVRVHITGAVTVYTGTSPHGQGLETTMAQIVAQRLGCDPQNVEVIHGDTGTGPQGLGTYGSRSTAVGGESVARATAKIVDKARQIVAHQLEAAVDDIELSDGKFAVKGSPDKGMTIGEISMAAYIPENLPEGMEPGLEELAFYDPENFVFPFGAHACVVEVDPDTGNVDVVKYAAVDDCGPAINPKIIDGQVHGGIVHAIGQALFERIHYNEDGQLVTGNFADYAIPSAADVPSFDLDRTETPSPVNSLGVKGIGEAGTIAASPAITNAVIDALRPLGVTFINMPLGPQRVWEAIQEAKA